MFRLEKLLDEPDRLGWGAQQFDGDAWASRSDSPCSIADCCCGQCSRQCKSSLVSSPRTPGGAAPPCRRRKACRPEPGRVVERGQTRFWPSVQDEDWLAHDASRYFSVPLSALPSPWQTPGLRRDTKAPMGAVSVEHPRGASVCGRLSACAWAGGPTDGENTGTVQ